jgi:hypothetical protein
MDEFLVYAKTWVQWATENPGSVAGASVALVLAYFLLNRKSALERRSARDLAAIEQAHKGKYRDLRPLR